ncbi:MAG TPA: hypothetical protein VMU25_04590 [Candidatus Paceibacterota bacterium]|nr:hypothetical protein [Candidatus Paceibacterota bacterium]
MQPIRIPRPSDFHAHFRWGDMLDAVAPEIARHHKYVLAMPNNGPGEGGIIRTLGNAAYVYSRIMECCESIAGFAKPIMTLYHTSDITPKVVVDVLGSMYTGAIKNYPGHGGTTNSGLGIPFDEHDETIRAMQDCNVPLLIHAEDTHDKHGNLLPHAEREGHCVRERLWRFRDKYPGLMICVEHASTREAIDFVRADTSGRTVMTVTPQHLLFTANDFGKYSWRNHLRCMPYVKMEDDRQALLEFVTTGDWRCIAGSDSAPHLSTAKNKPFEEAACGCWLPHSIALYALAFLQKGPLVENHRLNFIRFMSWNGPDWWRLERPKLTDMIVIREETEHDIPDPTPVPALNDVIIPLGWSENPDRLKVGFAAVSA